MICESGPAGLPLDRFFLCSCSRMYFAQFAYNDSGFHLEV